MNAEFFAANRRRFLDMLEEGSVAFFYSGVMAVKSNDQHMKPFCVNRSFYYLTGIDSQNVWLVLSKKASGASEALFMEQPDEFLIKWNGWMLTKERAAAASGLSESSVRYVQDMDRFVAGQLFDGRQVGTKPLSAWFCFDRLSMNAAPTRAEEYAKMVREKYPSVQIRNATPLISHLRAIKTDEEVACIRRAGDVTIEALKQMLRTARPGEREYQWAADYEHYVARQGLRNGFTTIAASGANAVMLHYNDNDCVVNEGDLFLFDLGAEHANYSADVSRTFPVSGKFSPRQRELFGIVREAMELAKDKMRPGVAVREPQQAVIDFYKKALRSAKLITEDSQVGRYYYHGVSHSLGLDVHDPHDRTEYEPGMVITCEPGLYVKEEGIGIRLENDILVTQGAAEDLIGDRLLDVEEIEALMAR